MNYPNVGFRDAILEAMPDGRFRLTDPKDNSPVCRIEFHNRKAARNWGHSRGFRILEKQSPTSAAFPRPGS
ncbi:MAG: hypothetical protein D6781_02385 [Verrucomicrobia bacterium]|nr:MAG: hypothetical protein D6781_02385 [Verrucomicrobiota bacterium]